MLAMGFADRKVVEFDEDDERAQVSCAISDETRLSCELRVCDRRCVGSLVEGDCYETRSTGV